MSAGSDVAYYLDRVREVLANADRGLTDVESNKKMSDVDKRKVRTATLCALHYGGPCTVPALYHCTPPDRIVGIPAPPTPFSFPREPHFPFLSPTAQTLTPS